jgi:hypothetical protein
MSGAGTKHSPWVEASARRTSPPGRTGFSPVGSVSARARNSSSDHEGIEVITKKKFSFARLTPFASGCYSRRVFGTRVSRRKIRPLGSKPQFAFLESCPLEFGKLRAVVIASKQARRSPSERQTPPASVRVRGALEQSIAGRNHSPQPPAGSRVRRCGS